MKGVSSDNARYLRELAYVVLTPGTGGGVPHARVVSASDLPSYAAAHPDRTFMIPRQHLAAIADQIAQNPYPEAHFESWDTELKVVDVGRARQRIWLRVETGENYRNVQEYEATPDGVTPIRSLQYFGPGLGMMAGLVSIVVTMGTWIAIAVGAPLVWWARAKRGVA